jgi:hypothetical protein
MLEVSKVTSADREGLVSSVKTNLSIAYILFLTTSCATGVWMRPAKTDGPIDTSLITYVQNKPEIKAKEIEDKLVRRDGIGYGGYVAEVTPYTNTLIETTEREKGVHEMKSKSEVQKNIADMKSLLADKKTCFMVFVSSNTTIDSARPSNWLVKGKTQDGADFMDYKYEKTGMFSDIPQYKVDSGGGFTTNTWYNTGIYCGPKIEMERGFEVTVIPTIVPDHLKGQRIVLKWSLPRIPASENKQNVGSRGTDF